ncbi:4-coumarate--CoA ligase-like 9 [Magnolia sinica]|uniref:4-coumarate--CoA ligase-like 9 n=1 Tax=Magnolia sinica TaxID=86752 RepID=UPI002659AB16|nr:4-coumarate--CoA ligase-like 9 [Magnolia sinica]
MTKGMNFFKCSNCVTRNSLTSSSSLITVREIDLLEQGYNTFILISQYVGLLVIILYIMDRSSSFRLRTDHLLPRFHPPHTITVLSPHRSHPRPPSLHIPVLYFSLLSIGVVVSPSNPASTPPEISRQIHLSRPVITFAASASAPKLPPSLPTIFLDSPLFLSMIEPRGALGAVNYGSGGPNQSDAAAILYSTGTTGKIKGVVLTHWNIITLVTGFYAGQQERAALVMLLVMVLLFHVFGFSYCLKAVAMGETGDNGEV